MRMAKRKDPKKRKKNAIYKETPKRNGPLKVKSIRLG